MTTFLTPTAAGDDLSVRCSESSAERDVETVSSPRAGGESWEWQILGFHSPQGTWDKALSISEPVQREAGDSSRAFLFRGLCPVNPVECALCLAPWRRDNEAGRGTV